MTRKREVWLLVLIMALSLLTIALWAAGHTFGARLAYTSLLGVWFVRFVSGRHSRRQ